MEGPTTKLDEITCGMIWSRDRNLFTPLHHAVCSGALEAVKVLHQAGAGVNSSLGFCIEFCLCDFDDPCTDLRPNSCPSPLYLAAERGHLEIAEYLVDKKAKVEDPNASTDTSSPLYIATQNGHVEMVKFLLARGSRKYAYDNNGKNLLHIAAAKGNAELLRILIEWRGYEWREITRSGSVQM